MAGWKESSRLLVVGPQGSGKTAALALRAAELRSQGIAVLWIVPHIQAFRQVRETLRRAGGRAVVLTPAELAMKMLNRGDPENPKRLVFAGFDRLLETEINRSFPNAGQRTVSQAFSFRSDFRNQGKILANHATQPGVLEVALGQAMRKVPQADLKRFIHYLNERERTYFSGGFLDVPAACHAAGALVRSAGFLSRGYRGWSLLVDDGHELSPVEWQMLEGLAESLHSTCVTLSDCGQERTVEGSARARIETWRERIHERIHLRSQMRFTANVARYVQCQRENTGTESRLSVVTRGLVEGGDFSGYVHDTAEVMIQAVLDSVEGQMAEGIAPGRIGIVTRAEPILEKIIAGVHERRLEWRPIGMYKVAGAELWVAAECLARLARDGRDISAVLGMAGVKSLAAIHSTIDLIHEANETRQRFEGIIAEKKTVTGKWLMAVLNAARALSQSGPQGLVDAVRTAMPDAAANEFNAGTINYLGAMALASTRRRQPWERLIRDLQTAGWIYQTKQVLIGYPEDAAGLELDCLYVVGYTQGWFPLPNEDEVNGRSLVCDLLGRAGRVVQLHHANTFPEIDETKKFRPSQYWAETGLRIPDGPRPVSQPAPDFTYAGPKPG